MGRHTSAEHRASRRNFHVTRQAIGLGWRYVCGWHIVTPSRHLNGGGSAPLTPRRAAPLMPQVQRPSRPELRVRAVHLAVLAAGYVGLAFAVWAVADPDVTSAPMWPAAGLTLAALLRARRRDWPLVAGTIFAADLTANLLFGTALAPSLAWAAANTIEPLLGAAALRAVFHASEPNFDSPRAVMRFLATVMLAGAPLAALIGALTGHLAYGLDLLPTWRTWYVGDLLGILAVTPLALTARQLPGLVDLRLVALVALATGLTLLIFGDIVDSALPRPYTLGPLLVYAAVAYGTPGAALLGFVTTALADLLSALGYGPYAISAGDAGPIMELQVYVALQLFTMHVLAAMRAQLLHVAEHAERLGVAQLIDPLTGAGNRRQLDLALDDLTEHAAPGTQVATGSVLFLDLDDFKPVNDAFGHDVGDEVLRIVAQRVSRLVRHTDTIARLGGDEFAIVCPGMGPADAGELSRRISERVAAPMSIDDHVVAVTVSVGAASCHGPDCRAADLLRAADQDMYRAKSARGGDGR